MKPTLTWLEDPEVFSVSRLAAHSDHFFYESESDWKRGEETLRQSLNGEWEFAVYPNPASVPKPLEDWGKTVFPKNKIRVPGHIELQGYGQIQYTNAAYPWDGHSFLRPPEVDWEDLPVGFYSRQFNLGEGLREKRVCLSFQGAEQAIYVWLNGEFIGYSEDSFTPSEFDVTDQVRERGNRICVAVFKRCSASWIEDQDFFRFSGLFRDVFLYAKPESHIEDISVTATLDDRYLGGRLKAEVEVSGQMDVDVVFELLSRENTIEASGKLTRTEKGFAVEADIHDVEVWDVERPNLYTFLLKILNPEGRVVEVAPCSIGFRRFEIIDKVMCLNGRRLLINGVNRHEWSPRRGRSITEDDMREDIDILKRNHINAVRTCHYPDQSLWYRLCDEAGICVMDETNMESHGSWQKAMGTMDASWNVPGNHEEWRECCIDRARSMYERDKNHACILWWSCGNESHMGDVIEDMCRFFHEKDLGRLVHYEGVVHDRSYDACTDVESRMYASPDAVREYLEGSPAKPMLLCEYMHDMGNSMGGMESYMKLREEFPMFQGGFIWDYIDQALYYENEDGREVLGYGGDFGDRPTDYSFSGDGIMFADRTEKPAVQEVRYWYQDVKTRECWDRLNREYQEAFCDTVMADWDKERTSVKKKMKVVHSDYNIGIKGEDFHYMFSLQEGGPVSIRSEGEECLYRAPMPAFWRASTENDKGNRFPVKNAAWFGAEMFCRMRKCMMYEIVDGKEICIDPMDFAGRKAAAENVESVRICYTYEVPLCPEPEFSVTYTVESGRIHVKVRYEGVEGAPELPLLGLRFVLPGRLETYSWAGLSGETYPDRYKGGEFGIHTAQVETAKYLVPQECQNHMYTLQMRAGRLKFIMDETPFQFSVLPHTPAELESALHREELPDSGRTVVSILGFMRGVGGIDSWWSDVEEPYRLPGDRTYEYAFYIAPGLK